MTDTDTSAALPEDIDGTRSEWWVDLALRKMIGGALRLPWERRVPLVGALTERVIAPLAGYRTRAMENLEYIYPELDRSQRRRIARAVCNNAGRTMIENYDTDGLLARTRDQEITGPGLDALNEAKRQSRPVMLVTGHIGNFEVPRAALAHRGFDIGGLYRPLSNPFFNDHYRRNMERLSGPVFPQGAKGTLGLVRHLRDGGFGVLLIDVHASRGLPLDFLGKPAPTLTSAADIAIKTDALLVPFFGIRNPDGLTFSVQIDEPIARATPQQMMQRATAALEQRVTAHIEQWFWVHRRWKSLA